jgi:very-short-patch-repair endonuclease
MEALVAIDMAVRLRLTDPIALAKYAEAAKGRPGMSRLRSLALLAEPAESPMETRLRWVLIEGGLPRPEVQTNLGDRAARFVGRADLYYPAARLAIEYDGGNHRERLIDDDRRQNLLVNAGYRLLRFTAADVQGRPDAVVAQVRAALGLTFRAFRAKRTFRESPKELFAQNEPKREAAPATARRGSGSADKRR